MGVSIAAAGSVHLTPRCTLRGGYAKLFGLLLVFPVLWGPVVFYTVMVQTAPLHPPGMLNGVGEGLLAEIVFDAVYVVVAILLGILLHHFQQTAAERKEQLLWDKLNRTDFAEASHVEELSARSNDKRIQRSLENVQNIDRRQHEAEP